MALGLGLTLSLMMSQRNDAKVITFTDASNWSDQGISIMDFTTGSLLLNITIQTSNGVSHTYAGIDLFDTFGEFLSGSDLVFDVNPSMLIDTESGIALGTEEDVFPDGVYTISYIYNDFNNPEFSFTRYALVDGVVNKSIVKLLVSIPAKYECGGPHEKQVMNIVYANAYLTSLRASTTIVNVEHILKTLRTLEDILINGNIYTW